jgi:hypothetical protein
MAAPQGYAYETSGSDAYARGAGWLTLAATMLGLAGTFNIIDGVVAVSKSKFFAPHAVYVFSNLHTWGWIVMILGIVQLLAAGAIFSGSEFARWFGILAAGLNAIGQLMFVQAYPWWSLSLFAIDIMVIYALSAYGGSQLRRD